MSTKRDDGMKTRGNYRKDFETDTAANLSLFQVTLMSFRMGQLLPLRYNVAQPDARRFLRLYDRSMNIYIYILFLLSGCTIELELLCFVFPSPCLRH